MKQSGLFDTPVERSEYSTRIEADRLTLAFQGKLPERITLKPADEDQPGLFETQKGLFQEVGS